MKKFYVLCQLSLSSVYKTLVPIKARDVKHAIKMAKIMGLIPYEVLRGK